jgi:sugar diacid utilization regulator
MTKQEATIIVELAHHQLSALQTAKTLNYHRNTIYYHVRNIRKETGLDPYDFFDMQTLYPMAKEFLQSKGGAAV